MARAVAYKHIQKDMFSSKQTVEDTLAYVVGKDGPYYSVCKFLGSDFHWSVHEGNVLATFDADHKIWQYLYL